MSFHEKSFWIMGLLLTIIGGWYLKSVWEISQELGETAPPILWLAIVAVIFLVVGAIVGHILAAVISPNDADDTEDERDKQILRQSGNLSGYVLGIGCFAGLWHFFITSDGNLLFHIIVGSLIASQIAEYILTIVFYRRGAL